MRKIICCLFMIVLWTGMFIQNTSVADVQLKQFKAGDVIYADDVNANFQVLADTIKQLQTLVAELQKQNKSVTEENQVLKASIAALQAEIATLKKQPVAAAPTSRPRPATQTSPTKTTQYSLRSTPKTVSDKEVRQVFGLDQNMRPLQYIVNDFEVKDDVVIDHATGLIWQQSGSPTSLTYQGAQQYVQRVNNDHFAGYTDWRLPTVNELLSLMTKERQSNGLYINSVFGVTQHWCWSADTKSVGAAWSVSFGDSLVNWYLLSGYTFSVRCVRSGQ